MEAVAGLDIGSSHIVAAVAVPPSPAARELKPGREPKDTKHPPASPVVKGLKVGSADTLGLRRGQVIEPEALSHSIREALTRAESAAGARVGSVCIGLSGHTVEFCRKRYGNLIGKRRVNQQDIDRINRLAMVSDLPPGRRIIQALPIEYLADGAPVPGKPLGVHCSRLEAESIIITADSRLVDQLVEAVHGSGYKVNIIDFFPSTLAAGEEILNQVQQRLGTVLVDIGGSCTCILVYNHGYPVGFDVLPVGSDHVTSDLAVCLRTTLAGAEEVKINIGLGPGRAPGADCEQDGMVTIPRLSGSGFNEVPVKTAVEIIEARICEILDLVRSSVSKLTGGLDLPAGLVITGGGSRLRGLDLFVPDYLGVKVRFGSPGMEGEKEFHHGVNTAGAVGLLKYILNYHHPAEAEHQPPPDLWSRVKGFFRVSG